MRRHHHQDDEINDLGTMEMMMMTTTTSAHEALELPTTTRPTNNHSTAVTSTETTTTTTHDNDVDPLTVVSDDGAAIDSSSSSSSSSSSLNVLQAAALLTADVLGTGLLALPENVAVLGYGVGMTILIISLPINWWAGYLLSKTADGMDRDKIATQRRQRRKTRNDDEGETEDQLHPKDVHSSSSSSSSSSITRSKHRRKYNSVETQDDDFKDEAFESAQTDNDYDEYDDDYKTKYDNEPDGLFIDNNKLSFSTTTNNPTTSTSTTTFNDLIELTEALFSPPPPPPPSRDTTTSISTTSTPTVSSSSSSSTTTIFNATSYVRWIFSINIFLVLGDYMLVMAYAVSAIFEDSICLVHAGILATIMMFGLTQFRRLGDLGKWITISSLVSLAVVVLLCLISAKGYGADQKVEEEETDDEQDDATNSDPRNVPLLRKLSAVASIAFATGTNKLLLNVRHEMSEPSKAPQMMGISMTIFGSVYIGIALLAGSNPPGFLFAAIPIGTISRRIAGVCLWMHISVSYAINSQALCASLEKQNRQSKRQRQQYSSIVTNNNNNHINNDHDDTAVDEAVSEEDEHNDDDIDNKSNTEPTPTTVAAATTTTTTTTTTNNNNHWWLIMTASVAISSYLVANAIPFFKDLVALIGALTSIPLTLIVPVVQHRKYHNFSLWCPKPSSSSSSSMTSYLLLLFGVLYLIIGLIGAVGSIALDWEQDKGKPFACE